MARAAAQKTEERRDLSLTHARIEVRDGADGSHRFAGHAAVFDSRTAIGNPLTWGFYEEIAPGAFAKTIGEGDARFLIDHDSYYVLARKSAGTLTLREDGIGLEVDAPLDEDLSYVKDLVTNLRNGNITGMSFGFRVVKDEWTEETVELSNGDSTEVEVRRIQEVKLIEVSAVTFPAYEETDAGLRALRSRGDFDAIARRTQFRPELAVLLDELGARKQKSDVDSTVDEPREGTRSEDADIEEADTEPAVTTRNAPTMSEQVKARMRALQAQLRHVA